MTSCRLPAGASRRLALHFGGRNAELRSLSGTKMTGRRLPAGAGQRLAPHFRVRRVF